MNSEQIKNFIKEIELFRDLDDKESDVIAAGIILKNYKKDSLLFVESNPRTGLWIILEGKLNYLKKLHSVRRNGLAFLLNMIFLAKDRL
jgi:signal-transduction protein with cAMP-binding, CBS, and nucleotidyltransferase domain